MIPSFINAPASMQHLGHDTFAAIQHFYGLVQKGFPFMMTYHHHDMSFSEDIVPFNQS